VTNAPSLRPLFLFSQPRSGSTLVQRVLGAHSQISTASEPWFLLPLSYMRKPLGARAEYWHVLSTQAVNDFSEQALPGGNLAWRTAVRSFVLDLYAQAAGPGVTYFLDKTPRYYLIAEEISELFPEAKIVFLWRNPLAVVASLLETFRRGEFEPYLWKEDILSAGGRLVAANLALTDRSYAVRYEDLVVASSEPHWRGLFDYLELEWEPEVLMTFSQVKLRGRAGDDTTTAKYHGLSSLPIDGWKRTFEGRVRQAWGRYALRTIGKASLEHMGYDAEVLDQELRALGLGSLVRTAKDVPLLAASRVRHSLRSYTLRMDDGVRPRSSKC